MTKAACFPLVPLSQVCGHRGLMVDGDWVESKDQHPDGDTRLIQLADIGEGTYLDRSRRYLTSKTASRLRCTHLQPADILVARMPDPIGRACVFPGEAQPCVTVVDVCIVRPDPAIADVRFLVNSINSPDFRKQILRHVKGTTRQRISRSNLERIRIPLPPLDEQRRIAAILDHADALRAKRRASLAKLDSLAQSIFLEMFGRVPANTRGWPMTSVRQAGRVQLGRQRAPQYQTGKHTTPYLRVANVFENRIDLSDLLSMDFDDEDYKAYRLEAGDILLNEGQSTELVGRPAMWQDQQPGCCFQNTLVRFQSDRSKVLPAFALGVFLHYFRAGEFAKISSKTSSVAHLGAGRFAAMPFPLPEMKLQREFAERIEASERTVDATLKSLRRHEDLFSSLQHLAFQGDL